MQDKIILVKTTIAALVLALFMLPGASYADWGHNDGRFYRYHDHPHWGYHYRYLPHGYFSIWVGGARYYYYDGLYYNYAGGDYVLVSPPLGAVVTSVPSDFQPVIINGQTYYVDNGTYYWHTPHGYQLVTAPVVATPSVTTVVRTQVQSQDAFTVNVPNNRGGFTAVVLKRSGRGYLGPQGEFYSDFPKVSQLKVMYGR